MMRTIADKSFLIYILSMCNIIIYYIFRLIQFYNYIELVFNMIKRENE